MRKWLGVVWVMAVILLTGCPGNNVKQDSHPAAQQPLEPVVVDDPAVAQVPSNDGVQEAGPQVLVHISDKYRSDFRKLKLHRLDASEFDVPVVINDDVIKWLLFYSGSAEKTASSWIGRSGVWAPMIDHHLAELELPSDLRYVAMIESGFNAHAVSSAKAVGMWQFMPATGRYMDLHIDRYVDERRDPVKSTEAAARYFTYLNKRFDDWVWVLAAYNGGEGRVASARKKYPNSSYWELCDRRLLPSETCQYVPRFMSMMIIAHRPGAYGIRFEREAPLEYDVVDVPGGVVLDLIAECADASVEEVVYLNPELRRHFTPPGVNNYQVKIPKGGSESFDERLAALPKDKLQGVVHVVRSGETLSHVAVRYGVSVQDIMRANGIRDARRVRVGAELTVPGLLSMSGKSSQKTKVAAKTKGKSTRGSSEKRSANHYTVVKGDSLWTVARRHGVTVNEIKGWNGLKSDSLSIGQRLEIHVSEGVASRSVHTVKAGDSLWSVSKLYGVDVKSLRKWNNLRSDRLYPGDQLRVHP